MRIELKTFEIAGFVYRYILDLENTSDDFIRQQRQYRTVNERNFYGVLITTEEVE